MCKAGSGYFINSGGEWKKFWLGENPGKAWTAVAAKLGCRESLQLWMLSPGRAEAVSTWAKGASPLLGLCPPASVCSEQSLPRPMSLGRSPTGDAAGQQVRSIPGCFTNGTYLIQILKIATI